MKKYFTVFLLVTLSGILTPTYGQWQEHIIDDDINLAVSVDVADMIGDTTPELIVTNFSGARLMLYQNNFPDTTWSKDTIAYAGVTFAWSGDIDGNDTLDIVACIYTARAIVWYKNNHPTWTRYTIDANTDNGDFILVADFNNDDKPDVVTAGAYGQGGDVVWYENNLPDPIWTKHTIESGSERYPSLNVADFDGDGLLDVAATMNAANKVVWFRNENDTLPWPKYTIDDSLNGAWGINSGDIDGDGTIDIFATGRSAWDVVWYKNNLPDTKWTKNIIDSNQTSAGWVDVAYVDGDDTMDVIANGLSGDNVVWYENNHPNWVKNPINTDLPQPRLFAVLDVDGDEMNDVIVPAYDRVVWYENPIITIPAAPILIEPIGSIDSTEVEFIWTSSYPEIDWYWFEIATDNQFTNSFIDSTITNTTYLYSNLNYGESYWWRVKAYNVMGWGEFSDVESILVVSVEGNKNLPTEYSLVQNYPNPFNPATRIKYSIPELSFVTIKVYDVLGSEVATLVNEEKAVGYYELEFNATALPSGVYFYQLRAGDTSTGSGQGFVETKKMVLMK